VLEDTGVLVPDNVLVSTAAFEVAIVLGRGAIEPVIDIGKLEVITLVPDEETGEVVLEASQPI